jgi:GGDEF domain-containing protein
VRIRRTAQKVHEALGKLDELVKAGHLEPHHAEALRQHAFKDPMTGHVMGNKFAYTDFLNRAEDSKGGVHVVMDGNDFKSVNDKFGHETGDRAIKAMGQACARPWTRRRPRAGQALPGRR